MNTWDTPETLTSLAATMPPVQDSAVDMVSLCFFNSSTTAISRLTFSSVV